MISFVHVDQNVQSKMKVMDCSPGEELFISWVGGVPASSGSLWSSLLALTGKEVLNLFSRFTAEWDPGCFTRMS